MVASLVSATMAPPSGRSWPGEGCDQQQGGSGVDGDVLVETLGGCVENSCRYVVGVAEDQCTDRPPIPCNRVDQSLRSVRSRQIARIVGVPQVTRRNIPTVRDKPRGNAGGDAVGSGGSGDECKGHAGTLGDRTSARSSAFRSPGRR